MWAFFIQHSCHNSLRAERMSVCAAYSLSVRPCSHLFSSPFLCFHLSFPDHHAHVSSLLLISPLFSSSIRPWLFFSYFLMFSPSIQRSWLFSSYPHPTFHSSPVFIYLLTTHYPPPLSLHFFLSSFLLLFFPVPHLPLVFSPLLRSLLSAIISSSSLFLSSPHLSMRFISSHPTQFIRLFSPLFLSSSIIFMSSPSLLFHLILSFLFSPSLFSSLKVSSAFITSPVLLPFQHTFLFSFLLSPSSGPVKVGGLTVLTQP